MVELTLSLISLAIAATLQPPQVIAMIILLQTRLGTINGLAYLAGMTTFRLALGAAVWILFSLLVPDWADHGLAAVNSWMKFHARSIGLMVAVIFGLVFLAIGFEHLGVF